MKNLRKVKKGIAAVLAAAMCIAAAGCGSGGTVGKDGNTLKYYFPLNAQDDNDMIMSKANEIIKEKLGVDMQFIAVDFANYSQKMQLINASREVYDLCFTSNWSNDYYQNIENKNLMELDDLLETHAPGLVDRIGKRYFDGVRVNGKIYGVINRQIMARQTGYVIPYEYANELDMDFAKQFETLGGIEEYIKTVQAKHPEAQKVFPLSSAFLRANGLEFFMGDTFPVAVYTDKQDAPVVINPYESEEFKKYLVERKRWVAEKIAPENMVVDNEALNAQWFTNGQLSAPISALSTNKPGVEAEMLAQHEVSLKAVPIGKPIINSGTVLASMLGISATSKSPENAMKYINLINTDKELYNLLAFGIEGRNYTKTGDNRIELSKEHSYIAANWAIGDVFNSYLLEGQEDNVWEETAKMNEEAELSPLFGFAADTETLSVQISNCTSVVNEFTKPLDWGVGDVDALYAEFTQKLKEAGIDEIITELQKQIDTWYQNK